MMNKNGRLAIMQIMILVFGIIAISYAIGSEIGEVSAKYKVGDLVKFKDFKDRVSTNSLQIKSISKDGTYIADILGADGKVTRANTKWSNQELLDYSAFKSNPANTPAINAGGTPIDARSKLLGRGTATTGTTGLSQIPSSQGGTFKSWIKDASPATQDKYIEAGKLRTKGGAINIANANKLENTIASDFIFEQKAENSMTFSMKEGVVLGKDSFRSITKTRNNNFYGINTKGERIELTETHKEALKDKGFVDVSAKGFTLNKARATTGTTAGDWLMKGKNAWGYGMSNAVGHLVSGVQWAIATAGVVSAVLAFIPGMGSNTKFALGAAITGGVLAGRFSQGLYESFGWATEGDWGGAVSGGVTGIAVAGAIFVMMYKSENQEVIKFDCYPWDAPTGGSNCEVCNDGIIPCSEYQCKSLGQACQLINENTDDSKCIWQNKNDVGFPVITPDKNILTTNHDYTPDKTISPPDRGVRIISSETKSTCVKPFTPLEFGFNTDEPAKCKVDYKRKKEFDDMDFYFGGESIFAYNHTQIMSLPSPESIEDALADTNGTLEIMNDGQYKLYVRCQDANGNHNTGNFVFKFCVDEGPDTTAPLIIDTNLINGMPIAYNTTETRVELYVNEPADCRWDKLDKKYDDMDNSMSCASNAKEMNARMVYTCSEDLTGLKSNGADNKFNFRCRDKPTEIEDRNTNTESYKLSLIGTELLLIDSIEPNETIKGSSDVVAVTLEVETSAGYQDGESTCAYNIQDNNAGGYINFLDTNSYLHSQDIFVYPGDYNISIKCVDLGGNAAYGNARFEVESDGKEPTIVRAYRDGEYLSIITNEEAECVYDTVSCSYQYADGTAITTIDETNHYADWNSGNNLYIKCKDIYENQPTPSACSMIVRPFEVF